MQRCCSVFAYARGSSYTGEGCFEFPLLLDQKGKKSIFIHTFFLIKKYAKTQGRTMLLRSRPLPWPAVLPGWAFYHPGLRPPLRWRGMVWASMLAHPQNIVPGGGIIGAYVFSFHGPVFFIAFGSHADGAAAVVGIQLIH